MKKTFYPFAHHSMFALVMKDPQICKGFIERILPEKKVKSITYIDIEGPLFMRTELDSVRLNVMFEEDDEIYDLEIQTFSSPDIFARSRYGRAVMDITSLKPGEDFNDLKPSYLILLCLFDYFGLDEPMYDFRSYDIESGLELGDQSYTIIINGKCSEENTPEELRGLFAYINGGLTDPDDNSLDKSISDTWIESIHRRVTMLNQNREVKEVMTLKEDC